jgi:CHASE2 domain-containing sensor protein
MPKSFLQHIRQSFTESLSKLSQSVVARVSANKGHLLGGFLVGVLISLLVTAASLLGYLKPHENFVTDILQSAGKKKAENVALVFITEREYKAGFQGISPLSRKRLAEIVDVLTKLNARVIALDIDISDMTPDDQYLLSAFDRASSSGVSVVIIGSLKNEKINPVASERASSETLPYRDENLKFTKEGFILFDHFDPGDPWRDIGINTGVVFRLDQDGVFRKAEAFYVIDENKHGSDNSPFPLPSLPIAMAAAYLGIDEASMTLALSNPVGGVISLNTAKDRYKTIQLRIDKDGRITPNFIGNYQNFDHTVNLSGLLDDYGPGKTPGMTVFKGKIVLIGGVYDEKDFHMTPVGRMSGMEIMANITQSIISENLITHMNFYKAFIVEILLGAVVSFIFVLTTRFRATLICFMMVLPAVTVASVISFSSFYYWFDFIPTIAGVVLHGWFKKVEVHRSVEKYQRAMGGGVT